MNTSFREFNQEKRKGGMSWGPKGRTILQVGIQGSQEYSLPSKINSKARKEGRKL